MPKVHLFLLPLKNNSLYKFRFFSLALFISVLSKAQCPEDVYIYQLYPSGNICSPQYVTLRAQFYSNQYNVSGEFRWYANNTDTYPINTTYLNNGESLISDYSIYANDNTTIWVSFYNYTNACESYRTSYTFYISPPPELYIDYARKCGSDYAKVQLSSNTQGINFELYKLEYIYDEWYGYTLDYQLIQSNSTGYFEINNFDPANEQGSYFAKISQTYGCISPSYYPIYFEVNENEIVSFSGNREICEGNSTNITGIGNFVDFKWYSAQSNTLLYSGPVFTASSNSLPGIYSYYIKGISVNGCESPPVNFDIKVEPLPIDGSISSNLSSIYLGQSVLIKSSGGNGLPGYWCSNNGGQSWNIFQEAFIGKQSFLHKPESVGTYRYHVRNKTACGYCWDTQAPGCISNEYVDVVVLPTPPPPSIIGTHVTSDVSTVNFQYENCFLNSSCYDKKEKIKNEVPPWLIGGGWRTYFMIDGIYTHIWSTPKSLTENSNIDFKNDATGPALATSPYITQGNYSHQNPTENWKRNYHAIYSAHYFNHPSEGGISLGFCHSENKNVIEGGCGGNDDKLNTINPARTIDCNNHDTYSGGSPYQDGYLAYHGILSAVWTHNNQSTNWGQQYFENQLGPIAWPSTAYVNSSNLIATSGLKHPSSIIHNGYIYVFYADGGPYGDHVPQEEGRLEGIKVVRAPLENSLNPNNFEIYYKDIFGSEVWNPSLPAGFTKENMTQYSKIWGPKSTDILNDFNNSVQVNRFSVAKIKDSEYFIGLEEYYDKSDITLSGPKLKVALRFSIDLVNWSDRIMVVYTSDGFESSRMRYPIFLNKEGWSNTEIDINNFYILGTEGINKSVNRIWIHDYQITNPFRQIPNELTSEKTKESSFDNKLNSRYDSSFNWKIFPNPVTDVIYIQLNTEESSIIELSLINASGTKTIMPSTKNSKSGLIVRSFYLKDLTPGLYLVELLVNEKRYVKKIIKL